MRIWRSVRALFLKWFGSREEYWRARIQAVGVEAASHGAVRGADDFALYIRTLKSMAGDLDWAARIDRAEREHGFRPIDRVLAATQTTCAAGEITRRHGLDAWGAPGGFAFWDRAAGNFYVFVERNDIAMAREYLGRMERHAQGDRDWMPPFTSSLMGVPNVVSR